MLSEKEKLEEELKFLKESFELEVITKDEYENAKSRIERKLSDISEKRKEEEKPEAEEIKGAEAKEEEAAETKAEEAAEKEVRATEIEEEELKEKKEEETEIKEEKPDVEKEAAEKKEEEAAEIMEEKPKEKEEEQKKLEETDVYEEKPAYAEEPEIFEEGKKSGGKKIWAYIALVIILGFVSGYFIFSANSGAAGDSEEMPAGESAGLILCSSDEDCSREGMAGTCENPGKENAECKYTEDTRIKLTVLNSDKCFNCETGRVLSILHSFFPNIEAENIGFETEEGKEIAETLNINSLPAYILNSSVQQAANYYKFYNAFTQAGDSFVMKNTVANSNYYIKREEIPNTLDLFLEPGKDASIKAEENLKEFLQAFEGSVDFEKYSSDSKIVDELGINSFPAFLVNNKVKFSGVQSAEKIKENFCQMNRLDECSLELSKNLV